MLTALPSVRPSTSGTPRRLLRVSMFSRIGSPTDPQILVQFLAIVGLRKHRDIPEIKGNRIRPVMSHRPDELAVAERVIPLELDLPDFYLGPFLDLENQNHRVARSNPFILGRHLRKLPPMFSEQFLQYHFRLLDPRRIKLAFDAEPDFALLEPVQNVRFGDGVNSFIPDAANLRPLLHVENNDFPVGAVRRIFHAKFHVLKKLRVPQSLK